MSNILFPSNYYAENKNDAEESSFSLLLVEPDARLRQRLAEVLDAGGYEVTCAEDGQAALEQAQKREFAVVVTSLDLPRLDGIELLKALEERDPSTECILLAEPEHLLRVIDAADEGNVYNHFWKPLKDLGDLARAVARAMERRELRLSRAHFLAELRDAHEELRAARARMEQLDKVAALGQMVGTVTQDMESPLTSLLAYSQYLRARLQRSEAEPLTAAQLERVMDYLREMETGVRQCHQAVQGIVEYTQSHDEPPGPTLLPEVIETTLALMRHGMETRGISLRVQLADDLPPALANPRRLQQALTSILLNAQQALGKTGGTILLTGETLRNEEGQETAAQIAVRDTGPGIAPDALPHIFEPFFTTYPRKESLGIGLTIARNIVQEWGGDIEVESAPGQGTVVSVTLPLCMEMAVPIANGFSPAPVVGSRGHNDTLAA